MKETRFPKDSDLTPAGVEAAQQFAVEWAASATGIPGGCPHAIRECSMKQGWSTLRVDRSIVDQPIVIAGRTFAHVELMEDLREGQKIGAYTLEVRRAGAWTTLAEGESVAHKHLHKLAPTRAEAIRFRCTKSFAEPVRLRRFAAYA